MSRDEQRRRQRERAKGRAAFLLSKAGNEDRPYDELFRMVDAIMSEFMLTAKTK